jgi:signal transduction histidine kinase
LLLCMGFGLITLSHERLVAEVQAARESIDQVKRLAAVGRLASGVSHFFNNQLHAIRLANSLLRQSSVALDTHVSFCVDQIDNAVRRGSNITRRLQQYAQAKALHPSRFNPKLLVEEILPELRRAAGEKVDVTTSISAAIPPVEVDAELLKDALFALARNARDAMPAGGKLKISLREEQLASSSALEFDLASGPFVLMSITDTGPGMDDETQSHVFEPFFTTKGLANAEGLSLASAYGFLRQSGGTIAVKSTPLRGSTFELYLPKAASTNESSKSRPFRSRN